MPNNFRDIILRSDVLMAIGLVTILLVMIIPLPSMMLDIFLAANITAALMILVICIYTNKALDFAIFPSVLLITTLFRLSLNVASTRLILLKGNGGADAAGAVIQSFGQFVVGGNYVVGIVIFIILVVINFMVITKGAGRVAEVAARFTLDAMPGKQMAIDADLNAGLIDDKEARKRRKEISSEAEFYGAMDGASKFVRGDAIAGIVITLVNIGAGFVIGVIQKGMPASQAAANYTMLTVGDGLVSQIPALVISIAAGILVTRTASTGDLGADLKKQFTLNPRAIIIVSAIMFGFALIPGLPKVSFFLIAVALAFFGRYLMKQKEREEQLAKESQVTETPDIPEEPETLPPVDILQLEVGYGLVPFVDSNQDGAVLDRIRATRKQFADAIGFVVPAVRVQDNLQLSPNEYNILLKGVSIAQGELMPDHHLAIDSGTATEKIRGIETKDPTFGIPAIWIGEDKKELAKMSGYTVVDCTTVMATHINEVIKTHAHEMVGRQETQDLLDNLSLTSPKLVEEVLSVLNLGKVMRVLQNLLREQVTVRDMRTIMETLADWAEATDDPDQLTEYVRQALGRSISSKFAADNTMEVITLSREVETTLGEAVRISGKTSYLHLAPEYAQPLLENLADIISKFVRGGNAVVLCGPTVRPHLQKLAERYIPNLAVLSHHEIAPNMNVKSIATVTVNE